jgi:hypothetical protein
MKEMLLGKGNDEHVVNCYFEALDGYRGFLEKHAFLF